MPSYAAIAPIAQHRGREPQLACDLDQRPTAARQQGDRLHLELIRKMTPFLAHSTPSRSPRSLAKVSTNSGEAQSAPRKTRAPWPEPGACGTPPGRSHRPRALEIPTSQYQALSCWPGPWTPPLVVAQHHLGTSMPSGGVHTIKVTTYCSGA